MGLQTLKAQTESPVQSWWLSLLAPVFDDNTDQGDEIDSELLSTCIIHSTHLR